MFSFINFATVIDVVNVKIRLDSFCGMKQSLYAFG